MKRTREDIKKLALKMMGTHKTPRQQELIDQELRSLTPVQKIWLHVELSLLEELLKKDDES